MFYLVPHMNLYAVFTLPLCQIRLHILCQAKMWASPLGLGNMPVRRVSRVGEGVALGASKRKGTG